MLRFKQHSLFAVGGTGMPRPDVDELVSVGQRAPTHAKTMTAERDQRIPPQPISILLVDDEPRNLVALEAALARLGCRAVAARSGHDALKCLLAQDFATILLDVHMPGMDGFETASLIRRRANSRSTPIIFLTADNRTGPRVLEAYELGAVDYIYKPFVADILRAKVSIFVEQFRQTAALQQHAAELTQVTADLIKHEQQVGALNADREEQREVFLATTVHDVRQPITVIKASVQLALRKLGKPGTDPATVASDLRRVDAQTNRMSLLLGTLSDTSRLTFGHLEPRRTHADLGVILHAHVECLEPEAADRVQIETSGEGDLAGRWDPALLERVIANLVSNALKYSPPDQPIRARFAATPESVKLSVIDHGIGIAGDELACLFSRYGRAGGAVAAGFEGTGLGLFLSKGIVEAHGGRIWAESAGAGLGMSVSMLLPRVSPPAADCGLAARFVSAQ